MRILYVLPALAAIMLTACGQPIEEETADNAVASPPAAETMHQDSHGQNDALTAQSDSEGGFESQKAEKLDQTDDNQRWDHLAGHYVGPEGLYLDVKAFPDDQFRLTGQYDLDNRGSWEGRADEHGIRFTRNGEEHTLRPTTGPGTGMKWLAEKKDCVVVTEGSEAYCRS